MGLNISIEVNYFTYLIRELYLRAIRMQGLYKIVSTIYVLLSPTHMSFPYGMFSLYRTWSLPSITQQKHSTFDFKTVIIPTSTAHVGRRLQIVGEGGKWLPIWMRRNVVRWQESICTSCINRSTDLYTLQNKPDGPWNTVPVCQEKLLNHLRQCSNTARRCLNTMISSKIQPWSSKVALGFEVTAIQTFKF